MEDIFILLKYTVTILSSILLFWDKLSPRFVIWKKNSEYSRLEFISEFLAFGFENRNRLVVEHAFSYYFKAKLDYETICILVRFKNITKSFSLYKKCRDYIKVGIDERFCFGSGYEHEAVRLKKKYISFALYFILYFIALIPPVFLLDFKGGGDLLVVIFLGLWAFGWGVFALTALDVGVCISSAEKLIEQQNKGA